MRNAKSRVRNSVEMAFAKACPPLQHHPMPRRTALFGSACLLLLIQPDNARSAGQPSATDSASAAVTLPRTVIVEKARTSIYIGSVSLSMPPLACDGRTLQGTYVTKVFPYFFYNEKGSLTIDLPENTFARLAAGETVPFSGRAQNTKGEPRRIEGRAVPADSLAGKIKVRVFVTPRIELIFNTTYRFQR